MNRQYKHCYPGMHRQLAEHSKYHVCPEAGPINKELGVDACDAKAIADYLWSHTGVIEEYLTVAKLPDEYGTSCSHNPTAETITCKKAQHQIVPVSYLAPLLQVMVSAVGLCEQEVPCVSRGWANRQGTGC